MEKRIDKKPGKISYKIMETEPKKGWKETTEKTKQANGQAGTINNLTIIHNLQETINKQTSSKTKTEIGKPTKRPDYIEQKHQ